MRIFTHWGGLTIPTGHNVSVTLLTLDYWTRQFYGPGYTPPRVDIEVDGGPVAKMTRLPRTCRPRPWCSSKWRCKGRTCSV